MQDLGCAELAGKPSTWAQAEIQGRSSSYDLDETSLVAGMDWQEAREVWVKLLKSFSCKIRINSRD